MKNTDLNVNYVGKSIELRRKQWKEQTAYISNYPGLLEEVQKYTWSYKSCKHPYLSCSKLKISLHKFVLSFLYGSDKVENILDKGNIIEHLDNNGLNCSYENLHIMSADYNKAKAFTIDKTNSKEYIYPYIIDVFYSHNEQLYQMQVFFNKNIFVEKSSKQNIEMFTYKYKNFCNLYSDWLYLINCREKESFDLNTIRADYRFLKYRPDIVLKEEEKNHIIIQRGDSFYLRLNCENNSNLVCLVKQTFKETNNI